MKKYDHSGFDSLSDEEKKQYLKDFAASLRNDRATEELQLIIDELVYIVQTDEIDMKQLSTISGVEINSIDDIDKYAKSEDLFNLILIAQTLGLTLRLERRGSRTVFFS